MLKEIPIFYHPNQVSRPDTISPSPAKPAQVVADWQARQYPMRIVAPVPVTREQLALAHDRTFVDAILNLRRRDGFGNRKSNVAASFPWTTGSFLSAAREALANGQVAVSPTSGFHHAGYDFNGGFCTFNGLMVTARALLAEGHIGSIGILDCDQHFGDGTEDIINRTNMRKKIVHITATQGYTRNAGAFLKRLPALMEAFTLCDLLMYQAGADPHVDDPLGGYLTTEQLLERDLIVFRATVRLGLSLVWNLAGGYQEPIKKILEIHSNTMQACVSEYCSI